MGRQTSDAGRCPVCGKEYDQQIVVERGDTWSDVFAGTPLSFFRRYQRRCAAQYDAESDADLSKGERAVYFHEGHEAHRLM